MLAAEPELERDPWVKLVLGREWDGDPNAPGGPLDWAPLLYACHSCFPTTALARELIERGADPNGVLRERVREHVRALRCRRESGTTPS